MASKPHLPGLEPVMDDRGFVTWTGTCSCGKWTAAGQTQTAVMWAHAQHSIRSTKPINPLVHDILQAKQGRGE